MSSLRKKLRSDVRFNAFNDAFSFEVLAQKPLVAAQAESNANDISAAVAGLYWDGLAETDSEKS